MTANEELDRRALAWLSEQFGETLDSMDKVTPWHIRTLVLWYGELVEYAKAPSKRSFKVAGLVDAVRSWLFATETGDEPTARRAMATMKRRTGYLIWRTFKTNDLKGAEVASLEVEGGVQTGQRSVEEKK